MNQEIRSTESQNLLYTYVSADNGNETPMFEPLTPRLNQERDYLSMVFSNDTSLFGFCYRAESSSPSQSSNVAMHAAQNCEALS